MMHKNCDIEFWNENGVKTIIHDQLRDLYTKEGIEYLKTAKGLKIRLEGLIKVDGNSLQTSANPHC